MAIRRASHTHIFKLKPWLDSLLFVAMLGDLGSGETGYRMQPATIQSDFHRDVNAIPANEKGRSIAG